MGLRAYCLVCGTETEIVQGFGGYQQSGMMGYGGAAVGQCCLDTQIRSCHIKSFCDFHGHLQNKGSQIIEPTRL